MVIAEDEEPMELLEDVKSIIANQLKISLDQLSADTNLEVLGADSLDLIEIIYQIEDKFGIDIPFNANEQSSIPFHTVRQVATAVGELVSAKVHP